MNGSGWADSMTAADIDTMTTNDATCTDHWRPRFDRLTDGPSILKLVYEGQERP